MAGSHVSGGMGVGAGGFTAARAALWAAVIPFIAGGSPPPLEPLLAVARRRPGEGMSVEPVARELVEAVLAHEFAGQPKLLEVIPTMSTRLASTLLDDPVSRGRMMRMWDRLQEAAR